MNSLIPSFADRQQNILNFLRERPFPAEYPDAVGLRGFCWRLQFFKRDDLHHYPFREKAQLNYACIGIYMQMCFCCSANVSNARPIMREKMKIRCHPTVLFFYQSSRLLIYS